MTPPHQAAPGLGCWAPLPKAGSMPRPLRHFLPTPSVADEKDRDGAQHGAGRVVETERQSALPRSLHGTASCHFPPPASDCSNVILLRLPPLPM